MKSICTRISVGLVLDWLGPLTLAEVYGLSSCQSSRVWTNDMGKTPLLSGCPSICPIWQVPQNSLIRSQITSDYTMKAWHHLKEKCSAGKAEKLVSENESKSNLFQCGFSAHVIQGKKVGNLTDQSELFSTSVATAPGFLLVGMCQLTFSHISQSLSLRSLMSQTQW